jgi:hypothetical protein
MGEGRSRKRAFSIIIKDVKFQIVFISKDFRGLGSWVQCGWGGGGGGGEKRDSISPALP